VGINRLAFNYYQNFIFIALSYFLLNVVLYGCVFMVSSGHLFKIQCPVTEASVCNQQLVLLDSDCVSRLSCTMAKLDLGPILLQFQKLPGQCIHHHQQTNVTYRNNFFSPNCAT
jgi:hypothetical protein